MFLHGSKWKYIRFLIILLLVVLTASTQSILDENYFSNMTLTRILRDGFFTFLSVTLVIWFQYKNPKQHVTQWKTINWNENPFSIFQPILFFNFSGWALVLSYIYPTINTYMHIPEHFLNGLFYIILGISMVFSSHIAAILFIPKNQNE